MSSTTRPLHTEKEALLARASFFAILASMTEDTTFTPLGDIVLIRVDEPKRETESGILIKEDWKTLPPTGTVVAIGDKVLNRDLIGRTVVFERYSSVILEDDYRLCKSANILAVKHETVR